MIYLLDLLGTLAFAVGGAYKAKSRHLNIFGVIFLGSLTAVGGGTIRDLIIGRTPLFYLKDPNYLLICLIAGTLTFFLPAFFKRTYSIFRFSDSVGMAAFAVIGVSICYDHVFADSSYSIIIVSLACVFMGMLTAFGGGVLRDTVLGDTPYALKQGSNYVMSAFWGSFSYFVVMFYYPPLGAILSLAITLYLREVLSPYGLYKKVYKNDGYKTAVNKLGRKKGARRLL